jgi:hypothetical protein
MKNNTGFFLKLSLFLVPVAVTATFVEFKLRSAPSSYSFKRQLIEQEGGQARVLVMGTSHAYYDFNPEGFSKPGLNLANTSQSLILDEQILEKFRQKFARLEAVVLDLTYFSFEYRLYGNSDDYREFLYRRIFQISGDGGWPSRFDLRDLSALFTFGQDLSKNILFFGFGQNVEKEVTRAGWFDSSHSNYPASPISDAAGKGRADFHTSILNPELTPYNIAAVRAIAALCQRENLHLILAQAPTFETYARHLDPAAEARFQSNVQRLESAYGLKFYDYLRDPRFHQEDFYDNDHLNSSGALKFSKIFDQEVLCKNMDCQGTAVN